MNFYSEFVDEKNTHLLSFVGYTILRALPIMFYMD